MKVSTRNVLAELLVEALDDSVAASMLRSFVAYGQTCEREPRRVALDEVLVLDGEAKLEEVQERLHACPLSSLASEQDVELAPEFTTEWPEIKSKLSQYGAALEEWSGETQGSDLDIVLCKGVILFNQHLFFEVHEVLEPQWMQAQGEVKSFLQGLIQIAVAFYHLGRGNIDGAQSLLHEGLLKISPHTPAFLGVELRDFITNLKECQEVVLNLRSETGEPFSGDSIPRMRLI